jgi:fructose-1,6-bisphosphatase/sedoheptulose 1,7-bisphosphatase-like protein
LLCQVNLSIFHALQTLGGAQEEGVLISNTIRCLDKQFWGEIKELKATA